MRSRTTRPLPYYVMLIILVLGALMILVTQLMLAGQRSELKAISRENKGLTACVTNLDRVIEDTHNVESIGRRALALGMQPVESAQLCPVVLRSGNMMVADAGTAEDIR